MLTGLGLITILCTSWLLTLVRLTFDIRNSSLNIFKWLHKFRRRRKSRRAIGIWRWVCSGRCRRNGSWRGCTWLRRSIVRGLYYALLRSFSCCLFSFWTYTSVVYTHSLQTVLRARSCWAWWVWSIGFCLSVVLRRCTYVYFWWG